MTSSNLHEIEQRLFQQAGGRENAYLILILQNPWCIDDENDGLSVHRKFNKMALSVSLEQDLFTLQQGSAPFDPVIFARVTNSADQQPFLQSEFNLTPVEQCPTLFQRKYSFVDNTYHAEASQIIPGAQLTEHRGKRFKREPIKIDSETSLANFLESQKMIVAPSLSSEVDESDFLTCARQNQSV